MIKPCDVPFALNTINYVDFVNEKYNVALNKLLLALEGVALPIAPATGLNRLSKKLSPVIARNLFLAIGSVTLLLALLLYSFINYILPKPTPVAQPPGISTSTQLSSASLTSVPITPEPPTSQTTPIILPWRLIGSHIVLDPDGKYWEKYQGDANLPGLYLRLKDVRSFGESPGDFLELKADGTFELAEGDNRVSGIWQPVEANKISLYVP